MGAQRLGVPHIELDALRHGPNWTETPDPEFRERVAQLIDRPGWVVDGNYAMVRDLVWARATAVVWVDPPLPIIMAQVIWRSVSRAVTRRELWNGNRERISTWLSPGHPIRWAWSTHAGRQREYLSLMQGHWLRLRSRAQIDAWLAGLRPGDDG